MAPQTHCYLCGSADRDGLPGKVRDMPSLQVLKCRDCGLVYMDSFDHISPEYYDQAYTDRNHPDSWQKFLNRCRADDDRRARDLQTILLNKNYLDVGCGGGGVLLQVRDRCQHAAGVEPQRRWREHLRERGVETFEALDAVPAAAFDVVSLFHVLEHIADPVPFLQTVATKLAPGGRVLIEVPSADDALLTLYESGPFSEFTYWSPHLFLYTNSTLRRLAAKAGLEVEYVRHVQRYPLSNHLRWLAKGTPGGHVDWAFLDSAALTEAYANQLAALGLTDSLLASVTSPSQ